MYTHIYIITTLVKYVIFYFTTNREVKLNVHVFSKPTGVIITNSFGISKGLYIHNDMLSVVAHTIPQVLG